MLAGIPKPLFYNHEFATGIATNTIITPPQGFQSLDRFFRTGSFFMTLPSFHVSPLSQRDGSPASINLAPTLPFRPIAKVDFH